MIISVSRTCVHDCAEIYLKITLNENVRTNTSNPTEINYKGRQIYQFPLCETEKTCLSKPTSCTYVEGSLDAMLMINMSLNYLIFFHHVLVCVLTEGNDAKCRYG